MKTLTKKDLALQIHLEVGLSVKSAKAAVDKLVELNKAAILEGLRIRLLNCTCIVSSIKSPRPGRNPKTGEYHEILSRVSIRASNNTSLGKKYLKSEMVSDLVMSSGYSLEDATAIAGLWREFLVKPMTSDCRIEIRGFGTFSYSESKAGKQTRNPKTGVNGELKCDRKKLKFKPSRLLTEEANSINGL